MHNGAMTRRFKACDLLKELETAINNAGGVRAFARHVGMSATFISAVRNERAEPSERLANALGFLDDGKRWIKAPALEEEPEELDA